MVECFFFMGEMDVHERRSTYLCNETVGTGTTIAQNTILRTRDTQRQVIDISAADVR